MIEIEMQDILRSTCNGYHECNAPVKQIFLSKCGKRSDYLQVEWECIEGKHQNYSEYKTWRTEDFFVGGAKALKLVFFCTLRAPAIKNVMAHLQC